MKTKTKVIGTTTVIVLFLFFCFSFKSADNIADAVMIRSRQHIYKESLSFIYVYKGDKQVEKIQIDKWSLENEEKNYDKLVTILQIYGKQGYEVISHSEISILNDGLLDTFMLTKK